MKQVAENQDGSSRTDAAAPHPDWVRMPPRADRIDELADFLEWFANAKPEDEKALRREIKRYFYDVGDRIGGDQLTAALAHVTDPDVDRETRQQILNDLEPYSRSDPAIEGQIQNLLYLGLSFLLPGGLPRAPKGAPKSPTIPERRAVEPSPTERATAIDTAYGYTPAQIWNLGFTTRGQIIHEIFGDGSLPPLFRIIDKLDFATGEATSIKSIDVRAATYQDANRFMNRVNAYVNRLTEYEGGLLQNVQVDLFQMTERVLAVEPVTNTDGLRRALSDAFARKNAFVPNPPKNNWPKPILLKYSGAKTWSAFVRNASLWSIDEEDGIYSITQYKEHPDGYLVRDKNKKIVFSFDTPADEVINGMIAILQEASQHGQ